MATAVTVRADFSADELRRLCDGLQARQPESASAVACGGAGWHEPSRCGPDRWHGPQTLRDWVHRFNAAGPDGLKDTWSNGPRPRLSPEQLAQLARSSKTGPDPAVDGVVRWRRIDLQQVIEEALRRRSITSACSTSF